MITLYNEDCLVRLKQMESGSVDIIFTSPPYNLGNKHHTGNNNINPYEDNMIEEEYQKWQIEILGECYRVIKDSGSLIYNHKNRIKNGIQITPYEWLLKTDFVIKQELVWMNGSQNFDKIRFYPMTERVYWLAKSPKTKLYNAINHHDVFGRDDWRPVGTKGVHTRAFPEKMVSDILKCFPEARVVMDIFMGSGTVGVVCQELEKDFVGVEIDERYFREGERRLKG